MHIVHEQTCAEQPQHCHNNATSCHKLQQVLIVRWDFAHQGRGAELRVSRCPQVSCLMPHASTVNCMALEFLRIFEGNFLGLSFHCNFSLEGKGWSLVMVQIVSFVVFLRVFSALGHVGNLQTVAVRLRGQDELIRKSHEALRAVLSKQNPRDHPVTSCLVLAFDL